MTQLDMGSNQQLDDSAITRKNNFAAARAAYFFAMVAVWPAADP